MSPRALWDDPYAAQAIDLLQQPAKARAAAVQQIAADQARAVEIGGNAQAQASQQGGQAWAAAAQQIGQLPQQIAAAREQSIKQQLGQQQLAAGAQQASDLKALDMAFQQPGGRDAIINSLPGHLRPSVTKQFNDADESSAKVQEAQLASETATNNYVTGLAETIKSHGYDPAATQLALSHAKMTFNKNPSLLQQVGQMEQSLQSAPTPDTVKGIVDPILAAKDAQEKPIILPATPRGGAPAQLIKPGSGAVVAAGTAAPAQQPTSASIAMDAAGGDAVKANALLHPVTPPASELKQVTLDGKSAQIWVNPKTKEITDVAGNPIANPEKRIGVIPPASTIINPQQQSDVKETVAGMKDGSLPPILPGRATKEYNALLAEAHRQGFDLTQAATDWAATQKHIATMNGAQQLRLNQSINALPEMLDKVDQLADQWKGGQFPLLNKANLALAKGGAYGPDVASVANKLDAQIADVTADLGNVYMGGNSPTDHALGLAGKSLSGDWDQKVLHDMVGLARNNVQIRQNSIKNTGVAGASASNPYGNQAPPAATETWVRDASGKLVKK